jgi:uncharacterized protein (TIGR02145 family)
MKTKLLSIICLFIIGLTSAQVPQSIKYQAVARNLDGVALKNTTIGVKASILSENIDGSIVYSEAFTVQSNKVGIFNLNLGQGEMLSGDFSSIDWGVTEYFLKIAIDADGGTNYLDMGTSQFLSVPYSLYTGSIYVNYSNDTLFIGDKYVVISGGGGPSGTVTDYDGNVYETVTIGTQTWMKENLRSLHYADGSTVEEVYAYEDNESYVSTYGRLYTWNAVMKMRKSSTPRSQGICPDGWHVPTKDEAEILINYLGGITVAGGKMKETGFIYWDDPNDGATNESGYSGRGAGLRGQTGNYTSLKQLGAVWTSDENGLKATRMALFHDIPNAFTGDFTKTIGYSARCIKD